jgi:hypothetical protein
MINPYFVYFSSFLISTLVSLLSWSSLYPETSPDLLLFLSITYVLALTFGIFFKKKYSTYPKKISFNTQSAKILFLIYFFWALEFAYGGGVPPIILAMQGIHYELADFGIPVFHPFLYTFSSFFSTYLFHSYLSSKSKQNLQLYILSFLPFILLFGRGALLINVCSSLFLYINLNFKIDLSKGFTIIKIFFVSTFFILSTFFVFGLAGNIRTAAVYEREDYNIILDIGKATTDFRNSIIPKEFFWSYLYIASPIGNLQQNVITSKVSNLTSNEFFQFISNEIMPDFISKRLNEVFAFPKKIPILAADELNVSTVYTNSFLYLSWIGLFLMALFLLLFPIAYISRLGKNNPLYLTGLSTLNTLYLFLMFDNMFAFSGLSFQLLYPLIMPKIMGIKLLD